jgi:hypothetical protein
MQRGYRDFSGEARYNVIKRFLKKSVNKLKKGK